MKRFSTIALLMFAVACIPLSLLAQTCPPACNVNLKVPSDASQPPAAEPGELKARVGETVLFRAEGSTKIIFAPHTPFEDQDGKKVYQFDARKCYPRELIVRSDTDKCDDREDRNDNKPYRGCKYIVIDNENPGRPTLDPYIIIYR